MCFAFVIFAISALLGSTGCIKRKDAYWNETQRVVFPLSEKTFMAGYEKKLRALGIVEKMTVLEGRTTEKYAYAYASVNQYVSLSLQTDVKSGKLCEATIVSSSIPNREEHTKADKAITLFVSTLSPAMEYGRIRQMIGAGYISMFAVMRDKSITGPWVDYQTPAQILGYGQGSVGSVNVETNEAWKRYDGVEYIFQVSPQSFSVRAVAVDSAFPF